MIYVNHLIIRVEGKGNAVITDVIYSSETRTDDKVQATAGSKEEYEAIKVNGYIDIISGDLASSRTDAWHLYTQASDTKD